MHLSRGHGRAVSSRALLQPPLCASSMQPLQSHLHASSTLFAVSIRGEAQAGLTNTRSAQLSCRGAGAPFMG